MKHINDTYRKLMQINNNDTIKCVYFIDCSLSITPINNIKEIDFWLDVRLCFMN